MSLAPRVIKSSPVYVYEQHVYGTSRLLYDKENHKTYVFVPIPKNASSWTKAVFKEALHFNYLTNSFESRLPDNINAGAILTCKREYVIVLRDPVDRWVTGVAQMVGSSGVKNLKNFQQLVDTPIVENNHVEPQCSFINNIEIQHTTFFDAGDNYTKKLFLWAKERDIKHLLSVPDIFGDRENSFNFSNKKTKEWCNFMNDLKLFLQDNKECYNNVCTAYYQDFALRESINFYGN